MKKSWIAVAAATIMLFSSVPVYAATPDEAVLISQQDDLTPLYTTAPDSSLRDYSAYMTEEQSIFPPMKRINSDIKSADRYSIRPKPRG